MCATPSISNRVLITVERKFEPLSERISAGIPILEKNWHKDSTTVRASIFFKGIASGYLVAKSMRVRIYYLFPLGVRRSGPMMSIATRLKGSSTTGSGISGALSFLLLLPRWHSGHSLHHTATSLPSPGQKNV